MLINAAKPVSRPTASLGSIFVQGIPWRVILEAPGFEHATICVAQPYAVPHALKEQLVSEEISG